MIWHFKSSWKAIRGGNLSLDKRQIAYSGFCLIYSVTDSLLSAAMACHRYPFLARSARSGWDLSVTHRLAGITDWLMSSICQSLTSQRHWDSVRRKAGRDSYSNPATDTWDKPMKRKIAAWEVGAGVVTETDRTETLNFSLNLKQTNQKQNKIKNKTTETRKQTQLWQHWLNHKIHFMFYSNSRLKKITSARVLPSGLSRLPWKGGHGQNGESVSLTDTELLI